MTSRARVALIGSEAQENLGLRSISAVLTGSGHECRVIPIDSAPALLPAQLAAFDPDIVGFSLIFQQYLPHYASLIKNLRRAVNSHFTVGGHFPSFEPATVLSHVPGLDSVVMFEGERPMLELTERIAGGQRWQSTKGIAYLKNGKLHKNQAPLPLDNLDELPLPDRRDIKGPKEIAYMLGSRGCMMKCSFCSIHNFYNHNGTPGRRLRNPSNVVDEFEMIHHELGTNVIAFNDDDFLSGGGKGIRWAHSVANEIIRRGLHKYVRWKISCRSNEVTMSNIAPLAEAGLAHVYLGVESGSSGSLKHLNKSLSAMAHYRAKQVMHELSLAFDYGFMLMEPWSTVQTVRENIVFLKNFSNDGSSIAMFCRMLPYSGTSACGSLRNENRLIVKEGSLVDYRFLDLKLDCYYNWVLDVFNERNFSENGTGPIMRNIMFYANMAEPDGPLTRQMRTLAARSNTQMVKTLSDGLEYIVMTAPHPLEDDEKLISLAEKQRTGDYEIREELAELLGKCAQKQIKNPQCLAGGF